MDLNLFHVSYEGGILEDPLGIPPDEMFQMTVSPEKAPNKPQEVRSTMRPAIRWRWTARK